MTNRRTNAIDQAFERKPLPVYVVSRHGYAKRCLSRETALLYLARFITIKVFERAQLPVEVPPIREEAPEGYVWVQQGWTDEFRRARARCVRRLRKLLARKREIQNWNERWKRMHDRYIKERDELQAIKPEGIQ